MAFASKYTDKDGALPVQLTGCRQCNPAGTVDSQSALAWGDWHTRTQCSLPRQRAHTIR